MLLPKPYFDLQLRFAARAAEIANLPIEDALRTHTTCYLNFDLGHSFDPADPTWQAFLDGFRRAAYPDIWTYDFYRACVPEWELPPEAFIRHSGCFSYHLTHHEGEPKKVRIHFTNRDTSGDGALSRARLSARLAELRALFAEARREAPDAAVVRGNSWLYNLDAYRRLFPPEYTADRRPALDPEFQYLALWGQFLDHHRQVKEDMATAFLARIAREVSLDGLGRAFPFQVLETECAIAHFHRFYRLND